MAKLPVMATMNYTPHASAEYFVKTLNAPQGAGQVQMFMPLFVLHQRGC